MRVLVCGGRDFTDTLFVYSKLDSLHDQIPFPGVDVLIEGNAKGVDRIAGYWARRRGIENQKFPADWKKHGRAAGPIRNKEMLVKGKPDLVVAFPGGRGTANMIKIANLAGIEIIDVGGWFHENGLDFSAQYIL